MIRLEPAGMDAAARIQSVFYGAGIAQTGSLPADPDENAMDAWLDTDDRRTETRLILCQQTGDVVGFGGLWGGAPKVNLGYFIAEQYAGRGIATMAAQLLLDEALSRPDILRITAATFQSNPASRRVLEKVGFTWTGEFDQFLPARGGNRAHWSFIYDQPDPVIRLEKAGIDAAARLLPVIDHDSLMQTGHLPLGPTVEKLNAWLASDNRGDGTWLILHRESGQVVGYAGLWHNTLGYYVSKDVTGQGIATRAARQLLVTAVDDPAIDKVMACAFHSNPASRRVLEKTGFTFVKNFIDHLPERGGDKPAWLFELKVG